MIQTKYSFFFQLFCRYLYFTSVLIFMDSLRILVDFNVASLCGNYPDLNDLLTVNQTVEVGKWMHGSLKRNPVIYIHSALSSDAFAAERSRA